MNWKDHPSVVVITVGLSALGVGWTLGYYSRGERISALEALVKTAETKTSALELSQKLELPQTLKSIESATTELRSQIRTFDDVQSLRRSKKETDDLLADAKRQIDTLNAKAKIADEVQRKLY